MHVFILLDNNHQSRPASQVTATIVSICTPVKMAAKTISMLNELNVNNEDSTIKVRIIRLWRQPIKSNPAKTMYYGLIFIDEQGNKMQASVDERWFMRFSKFLVEKNCLFIKNLKIGKDISKYKYVDNPLKGTFTPKTTITRCTDFSGALYGFTFTNFELLTRNELHENATVDIIGYIGNYFPIKDVKKRDGTLSKNMTLQVKDLEARTISLTLWDSYAEHMSDYLLTHKHDTDVVIILHFGMFKFYEGHAGVSNSFHVTKLIINEDIPDINSFKKSLLAVTDNDASTTSRSTSPSMKMSLHDDFLKAEFKHIAQLDDITKANSVVVLGTILPIYRHTKWYYDACKLCNKQVIEIVALDQTVDEDGQKGGQAKLYECPKCKQQLAETVMRYKIPLNVEDSTGVVSLVLFDWEANKILKKSANELYNEILDDDGDLFPDDLKNLADQRFAFKIEISDFNLKKNYKVYTISKATQDPKIVCALQKRLSVDQDMGMDFNDTDDGATPLGHQETSTESSLIENQSSGSSISANANLKRKRKLVVTSDDEDEELRNSGKKAYPSTMGTMALKEPHGKNHLLTPKLEK